MDIDAVIAALSEQFDPAEAEIVERLLRKYSGTIPDPQLVDDIGLALAIHRRTTRNPQ